MTRIFLIVGWLLVGLDLIIAAALLIARDSGDAATRGVAPGLGAALAIVGLIAAALLVWGGRGVGRPFVVVVGGLLVAIPIALGIGFILSPQWLVGVMYPSMRQSARPMLPSPQYAYPDAAGREAALALVMNDDDKLATILRASPTLDLTARLLLARGVNRNARDARVDTADWSPVTNQADQRGWATALVLLEGGVPRDYGTPVGSVLRTVIQKGEWQTTDSERADPAYQAVIAAAK